MNEDSTSKLYKLIDNIPLTPENSEMIEKIKKDLEKKDYTYKTKKRKST